MFFCFPCCFPNRFPETTGNKAAGNCVSHGYDGKQALLSIGVLPISMGSIDMKVGREYSRYLCDTDKKSLYCAGKSSIINLTNDWRCPQ